MSDEMKNIIVFGSNGMLGSYLCIYLSTLSDEFKQNKQNKYNVIGVSREKFEVTNDNITHLKSFLEDFNFTNNTIVINCIGLIPQRNKTKDNSLYFLVNTIFPLALEKACQKLNFRLLHASTDCVFSGSKNYGETYNETDLPDDENIYGLSKYLGEPLQSTVIRSSIIGEEIYNKLSFLEWVKTSKETINGFNNHYWNGITCLQYAKIVDQIISENLFWQGVRHLHSPSVVSKYDLCCIINNVYNCGLTIVPVNTPTIINKTLDTIYTLNKVFNIPCIEEQIKEQSEFKFF
jgi:dTDP-4-dehydrorhamnose reductase